MKYLFPLLLLLGCGHPTMMTRQTFADVDIGEPILQVEEKVGKPFAIRKNSDGTQEYEYIERISLGTEVVEEYHYYLVINNGQVVSKRLNQDRPPAFDLIDDDDPNDTDQQ
jgi:hypothetical protein